MTAKACHSAASLVDEKSSLSSVMTAKACHSASPLVDEESRLKAG
jgi:RNA polymerase subunit RPABC4/transcription elongation factor Spt4